jgi:hypothetical protein
MFRNVFHFLLKTTMVLVLFLSTINSYAKLDATKKEQSEGEEKDKNETNKETKLSTKTSSTTVISKLENAKTAGGTSNAALSSIVGGASGWRFQGSFTHIPKIRKDQEDTSEILTRADYTFNSRHRVRLEQFFTKYYTVYNNENELKPGDTGLSHYYTIPYNPYGLNMLWRSSLTLPISNNSVRDDLITKMSGSLIATKGFFNNKLLTFFVPYASYYWYEYALSKSGRNLPWYTLGASVSALYFITPSLSLYSGFGYTTDTLRQSQFDQAPSQIVNGNYQFDLSLSYQFNNQLSSSLSYFQGNNYIQNGRYEVVLFDNQNSRYSFGLTYIY